MIDHAHDLAVVFYGADFAGLFARRRPAVVDVEIRVILGAIDDEVLDRRAMAAVRVARFTSGQDVRADDRLITLEAMGPTMPIGTAFKVLENPRRVNDGLESEALLGSATV